MSEEKFGLTFMKKKPLTAKQRATAFNSIKASSAASIFNQSDDEDDEPEGRDAVNHTLAMAAAQQRSLKKVQRVVEKALEEDSNTFEYDEVYDDMNANRLQKDPRFERLNAAKGKDKPKPKAKYIHGLMKTADERKRLDQLRDERKAQKEKEEQQEEFGDKEEFVTEAFKERLTELHAYDKKLREEEEQEARNDVSKQTDMSKFYYNLLTNNESMGTQDDAVQRRPSLTAPSMPQAAADGKRKLIDTKRTSKIHDYGKRPKKSIQELLPEKEPEPSEEELRDKFARKADEKAIEDARARALARRKEKKNKPRPVMDD